mmetsp:Transcript_43046/g.111456  ORF Transcript_43046/g.111456 Transcript_43046/m.111456 type:complete len:98 (-) Transcript_43046:2914-3207(-)
MLRMKSGRGGRKEVDRTNQPTTRSVPPPSPPLQEKPKKQEKIRDPKRRDHEKDGMSIAVLALFASRQTDLSSFELSFLPNPLISSKWRQEGHPQRRS